MKSSVSLKALTMPKNGAKLGDKESTWPDILCVYCSATLWCREALGAAVLRGDVGER